MGYISLECENYSARIILGRHNEVTRAKQIRPTNSGILVEGFTDDPQIMFDRIVNGTDSDNQYSEIVDSAKNLKIPIVAAEPTWKPITIFYTNRFSRKDSLIFIALGLISNFTADQLIKHEGEISSKDPKLVILKKLSDLTISYVPCMKLIGETRNFLMAQRTYALAENLHRLGVKNPQLDLVVGANHVGIIDSLRMEANNRVSEILNNRFCKALIEPADLPRIHGIQYNRFMDMWQRLIFEDSRLVTS